MNIRIAIAGPILVLMTLGCGANDSINYESHDERADRLQQKMVRNLDVATTWMITDGLAVFSQLGKDGLHRQLLDEWGVQIWATPAIDSDRYIARFLIKARGIHYDIQSLHRQPINDQLYEIWVVKKIGASWTGFESAAEFYVTVADQSDGQRLVLTQSSRLIQNYQVGNATLSLPLDDLQLIYDLQPETFPSSYTGTDLDGIRVILDKSGLYELIRD